MEMRGQGMGKSMAAMIANRALLDQYLDAYKTIKVWHIWNGGNSIVEHSRDKDSGLCYAEETILP